MLKRRINLLLIVLVAVALVACSSLKLSGTSASTSSQTSGQNQQNPAANFANQPVESKLAIGTLQLEGTDKAITAAQAKTLLPLWKAVKSLNNSSTASNDEMTALYKQIEEAMTADQIAAIKSLSLSQTDLQALSQKYGVTMPQPGVNPQGTPQARSSSGTTGGNNANGGGFPGGPGGAPPDGGGPGGVVGGQSALSNGTTAQRTPQAGQGARRFGGGMNTMFVDPLIKILGTRAAA